MYTDPFKGAIERGSASDNASLFLALALILAMSATAFATTVTIADDAAEARTYNGYKLLNLTVSLKTGEHPDDCDGNNHKDGCYNYAYSVNTKYETILQKLAGEGKDIIEYLSGLTSDSDAGYGTLRGVADDIYQAIQEANIEADKPNLTATTNIDQGYWLFADVTNLSGKEDANSLVVIDTKGQTDLTITPKTGLPTIEKKVKDTNDSTGETSDWQDSADHDINDTVSFKLTATLPSNVAYYDSYKLVFHDTLSTGLTLDVSSIKVFAGNAEVTNNFNRPDTATGTFEISCDNILALKDNNNNDVTVTADTVFVVTYSATLNENAIIGAAGNPNTAYLEFSNNPYTDGTGKTKEDTVIVFTYQLTINKTDESDNALKGAGFILYKKNSEGTYVQIGDELKGDDMTTFTWKGLDDGEYKLEEKTVPAGYNKMDDIEFTITADHESNPQTLSAGNFGTGVFDTGIIEESIENKTGTILPETGARGTVMLITVSTMFVMVAAVFMVTRKKMSIYED